MYRRDIHVREKWACAWQKNATQTQPKKPSLPLHWNLEKLCLLQSIGYSRKASPSLVPNLPRPRPPSCTLSRPPPSPPVCGPKAKSNAGSTIKPIDLHHHLFNTFTAHSPLSPSQMSKYPSSLTSCSSQDSQNKTGPASPNLQSSPQTNLMLIRRVLCSITFISVLWTWTITSKTYSSACGNMLIVNVIVIVMLAFVK